MIAAWILYCALWSLWLSGVAWMTERLLLKTRGPVRMVWLSAMALSVVGPPLGYAMSRRERVAPTVPAVVSSSAANSPVMIRHYVPARGVDISPSFRTAAARADRPLAVAWIVSVLGLVLYIAGGVVRLHIVRRQWRPDVVAGTAVMISDDTGPALVGVFDMTIVIPAWALGLERDALALLLRHELEHRAAGDTRTLAIAQALLVFMPWNPVMWWQLRRLRLAIELDCDGRVLRGTSDLAAYGKLLLEFGRPSRGLRVAGAALADHRASHLEMRIRRMTRRAPARRGRVTALSIAATAIAIAIGCQLPTPPSPMPSADAFAVRHAARVDSSITMSDSLVAHVRSLIALDSVSRDIAVERDRRIAATEQALIRELARRDSVREFQRPRSSGDSLALKLFEAQIGVAMARDSVARKSWSAPLDTARWVYDSTLNMWPGFRVPTSHVDRVMDSLSRELAKLRMILTEDHPQIRALRAKLESVGSFLPDSIAAVEPSPGCTAAPGSSFIKLIVPDDAASRGGVIFVQSEITHGRGASVQFDDGMTCAGPGELRLYGRGAFDGRSIVVRSALQSSIAVVTGAGRVLVGPIPVPNEVHRYELRWTPR